jgi:hypothetical protein
MLLLLLGACGTSAGPAGKADSAAAVDTADLPCDQRTPTVTLGGSSVDELGRPIWTEMPEGSEQTMIHGPQGGWHILASADVQSTDPIVTLVYTITWPAHDDAQLSWSSVQVMLVDDDRCGGYYAGILGILDVSAVAEGDLDTPPELLAGEELVLHMDVTERYATSVTASDERHVIAVRDPADEPDTGE